jgi:hypothetical protein
MDGEPHMAEDMTPNRLAVQSKREASGSHKRRFSGAWWLKLVGLAPLGIIAVSYLFGVAFFGWRFTALVTAVVTGGLAYLGWRKPRLLGGLLVVFAPLGAFFMWVSLHVGGFNTWREFIVAMVVFSGVPLASGLLLIVAARWRTRARTPEQTRSHWQQFLLRLGFRPRA